MDFPDSRVPGECLELIHDLFTKDIVDDYDAEFGRGGFGFITNGRLYELSFNTEERPLAFTLSSGSDCPYWEASKESLDRLIKDMNKAHPSSNYCWRGVFGYQMGVSAEGSVPDSPDRKIFVQAELLRCKQVLDLALDGQSDVIFASKRERQAAAEAEPEDDPA
jgi:hypothetical protein